MRLDPRTPLQEELVQLLPFEAVGLRAVLSKEVLAVEVGADASRRLVLFRDGRVAREVPFETALGVGEVGPQSIGIVGGEVDGGMFFQELCDEDGR